jgi:polysaccharide export outer membrane protein
MKKEMALVLVLAAAAAAGAEQPAGPVSPAARSLETPAAYTIGAGDVLRIIVWKEPDLTGDVTVRVDGMITVPLLGDLQATGRSPGEVAETMSRAQERFVEKPKVTVAVSLSNSARFYVVGQVAKPGEFPLSSNTTVLHALALAGGLKEFARTDSIVIVRQDQTVVPVNYKRIADGKDVSQNVTLARGDTIVVP